MFTFNNSGSTGDAMATPTVRTKAMKNIARGLARTNSSTATMTGASKGLIDATMTTIAATAATRKTAKVAGMTQKLLARTVRAPVEEEVEEKTPRISADVVISSGVPVESVSGCIDLRLVSKFTLFKITLVCKYRN